MNNNNEAWPPPYTIVTNRRSKRLTIRITMQKGLELVIPKNTSMKRALEFLNSKYHWVQKHLPLLMRKHGQPALPANISLPAIHEEWTLEPNQRLSRKKSFEVSQATQSLFLDASLPVETSFSLLRSWLKKKGNQHLPDMLLKLSQEHNLPFDGVGVRLQQARWGSCTREKKINLNCKLLLLPYEIAEYVLIHELVHTIHFDHSRNFWNGVEAILPDYRERLAALKRLEHEMPNWVY